MINFVSHHLILNTHYLYFSSFNHFNNFFKHNSVKAYNSLINSQQTSKKEKIFNEWFVERGFAPYKSGYYSAHWVRNPFKLMETMLLNIIEFTKELVDVIVIKD